ncbi:MAG: hypothetical protein K8R40_13050 [Anaerolineaceae bacterium]|nr:hypothetical protein [Anaerolineaceae bacterium]
MRILVYGAGIIGSIITSQLEKAGYDVSILARRKRAQSIQDYGILSRTFETDAYYTARPKVIETLTPEDAYDIILVTLRRNNHDQVIPILAENTTTSTILFLGNNLGGAEDILAQIPAEKVMLGFGGTTGEKRGDIIYHFLDEKTSQVGTIEFGELDGSVSPRAVEIAEIFANAGFKAHISPNIDAWLKTHAATILPIAFAIYWCDGNNYRLANTRDGLLLLYRSVKESLRVLKKNKIPIIPKKYAAFTMVPEPIAIPFLKKALDCEFARIGMAEHANNAEDDMFFLAKEFKQLIDASELNTPHLDHLFSIIDAGQVPMPEGASEMKPDWKPIWIGAGILTGLLGVFSFFHTRKKKKE